MIEADTARAGAEALWAALAEQLEGLAELAVRPLSLDLNQASGQVERVQRAALDAVSLSAALTTLVREPDDPSLGG